MQMSEFYEFAELAGALNQGKDPLDESGKKILARPKHG